jgi:hypothetical protein
MAAEQHDCERHRRPAVASRVPLLPDGRQVTEYLCELDLAEERMSSRLGGSSIFEDFFSEFLIENELSRMVLSGAVEPGDRVTVEAGGDELHFEVDKGAAPEAKAGRREAEPASRA